MKPSISNRRRFAAQLGLTMVELMVALLLGLLLTGGAIQVFLANRATYEFNNGLQRLQENGRFALDALAYNVRMAGFLGCLSSVTVYNNLGSATTLPFDFANGIWGFEAAQTKPGDKLSPASIDPANSGNASDWSPNLVAPVLGNAIEGSDVLVVRNVNAQGYDLASPFTDPDKVRAAAGVTDFAVGDIGVVSDCQKASVFQITGIADATSGSVKMIDVTHTGTGTPGNATPSWDTTQQYGAGAQLLRGETWVYYVGRSDAGPPALFQMRLNTASGTKSELVAEELVSGVDTMQILYGVDDGLDGDLDDAYRRADEVESANEWNEVVTVRVGLLIRSPEPYGTEVDTGTYDVNGTLVDVSKLNDRRFRQVFTTTIAIRNRLP